MAGGKFMTFAVLVGALIGLVTALTVESSHRVQASAMSQVNAVTRQAVTEEEFGILWALLELTGLDAAVANGNLTVLAPNDSAFVATIAALGLGVVEVEDAVTTLATTLESLELTTLESLELDVVKTVETILLYHVLSGSLMSTDVLAATTLTPLLEGEVIMRGGEDMSATQLGDAATSVRDPELIVTDIEGGGNVFHVIDRVLLPSAIANLLELFVDESAGVMPTASGKGCGKCAEDELCTLTPWEEDADALCLPAPPMCYLSGARNKGVDNEMFVPFAPCCSGVESVPAPALGFGSWCLP